MAVIDRAPRSANIVADTDVECDLLDVADFESLAESHPAIKIKLWRIFALASAASCGRSTADISVFD